MSKNRKIHIDFGSWPRWEYLVNWLSNPSEHFSVKSPSDTLLTFDKWSAPWEALKKEFSTIRNWVSDQCATKMDIILWHFKYHNQIDLINWSYWWLDQSWYFFIDSASLCFSNFWVSEQDIANLHNQIASILKPWWYFILRGPWYSNRSNTDNQKKIENYLKYHLWGKYWIFSIASFRQLLPTEIELHDFTPPKWMDTAFEIVLRKNKT